MDPDEELVRHYRGGLYNTPHDATIAVQDSTDEWRDQLTQRSFELSLAVIAANWAVFGTLNAVLANGWAMASISVILAGLAITLVGTWLVAEDVGGRLGYAEENPQRWASQWKRYRGVDNPWPFTGRSGRIASRLRLAKAFIPVVGGVFFLIAIFRPPSSGAEPPAVKPAVQATAVTPPVVAPGKPSPGDPAKARNDGVVKKPEAPP